MSTYTCEDCVKAETCPVKGEVCGNFQLKKQNSDDPLADVAMPKIVDAGWLENDCYRPC